MKPIRDKILVKPCETETKTSGGLFIPDNAKEKPIKGEVCEVGSGRVTADGQIVPLEVSIGYTVIFNKGAGIKVSEDGVDYLILDESQILAVVQ